MIDHEYVTLTMYGVALFFAWQMFESIDKGRFFEAVCDLLVAVGATVVMFL